MLDYCLTPVMFFHHNDALTVYISLCTYISIKNLKNNNAVVIDRTRTVKV